MTNRDFYKLLPNGNDYQPLSPEESYDRAKGSMYEAWFDTLKASPWYKAMWDGHPVFNDPTPDAEGNNRAAKTKELFGDLRKVKFKEWWLSTGHRIFAERVPYIPVQTISVKFKKARHSLRRGANERPVQSMLIEIPLNLKPSAVRKQLTEIINEFDHFRTNFNRWEHSTADAPLSRDPNFTYFQISNWLEAFRQWEKNKSRKNQPYKLHDLCQDMGIAPELGFDGVEDIDVEPMRESERHRLMADAAEYDLKKARNLMANATFMDFPSLTTHDLATNYSASALKLAVKQATKPPSHDFNKSRQRKKEAEKRLKDAG